MALREVLGSDIDKRPVHDLANAENDTWIEQTRGDVRPIQGVSHQAGFSRCTQHEWDEQGPQPQLGLSKVLPEARPA